MSGAEDRLVVAREVDPQPGDIGVRAGRGRRRRACRGRPSGPSITSSGLAVTTQVGRRLGGEDLDHLVLDQAAADLGAVFDQVAVDQGQPGDAQLLAQAPARRRRRRPSSQRGWVQQVFAQRPGVWYLASARRCSSTSSPAHHEDADRLVPQARGDAPRASRPGSGGRRPRRGHARSCGVSARPGPVRWARFLIPILRCAIGRALTSFLFM